MLEEPKNHVRPLENALSCSIISSLPSKVMPLITQR
jgi:hypothetical protein